MSVTIVQGDILDAKENLILHQVNCKGVMSSGLAKQIRDKWPGVYEEYRWACEAASIEKNVFNPRLLGKTLYCSVGPAQWVVNLFGQEGFGREKDRIYTDYDALKGCLLSIHDSAWRCGWSIALPYGIGCGLGGGDWNSVVFPMILDIFENSDVEVKIYRR